MAAGYSFANGLRIELQSEWRQLDNLDLTGTGFGVAGPVILDGDVTIIPVMLNVQYSPFEVFGAQPFVGFGMGGAYLDIDADEAGPFNHDDAVFAYQFMAGVRTWLMDGLYSRLGYRYFATDDGNFGGTEFGVNNHIAEIGFVITFNWLG